MSDEHKGDGIRAAPSGPGASAWQLEPAYSSGQGLPGDLGIGRVEAARSKLPTWWLMFVRELADLWIGGKALLLILGYSIFLGIMAYVLASNSELSLIPPKEMAFLTVQSAISVGVFIGVIIGADSISGERERSTLEALLLTPTSRRQLVIGKFLAAVSPWPVAMVITVPYLAVLSQGDPVFGQSMIWGAVLGTLLAPGFTALGMLISTWSNSNKTSLFVSLIVYLLCLLPTQFPGNAQTGTMGRLLKTVNPMEAINHFLEKILVNNRTFDYLKHFLISPAVFSLVVFGLLFLFAGPRLRLEGGVPRPRLPRWSRAALVLLTLGLLGATGVPAVLAAPARQEPAGSSAAVHPVSIGIDVDYKVVKNGEPILFNTTVKNEGQASSPPLILAMNIINLNAQGDVVDPEDWSPQRTQYLQSLAPGQSLSNEWRVNTILEGNYMVYMVVIPEPGSADATTQPISSSGIHLTVERFVRINPGGVLPYVIGAPVVLILGIFFAYRYRRRQIDQDAAD